MSAPMRSSVPGWTRLSNRSRSGILSLEKWTHCLPRGRTVGPHLMASRCSQNCGHCEAIVRAKPDEKARRNRSRCPWSPEFAAAVQVRDFKASTDREYGALARRGYESLPSAQRRRPGTEMAAAAQDQMRAKNVDHPRTADVGKERAESDRAVGIDLDRAATLIVHQVSAQPRRDPCDHGRIESAREVERADAHPHAPLVATDHDPHPPQQARQEDQEHDKADRHERHQENAEEQCLAPALVLGVAWHGGPRGQRADQVPVNAGKCDDQEDGEQAVPEQAKNEEEQRGSEGAVRGADIEVAAGIFFTGAV